MNFAKKTHGSYQRDIIDIGKIFVHEADCMIDAYEISKPKGQDQLSTYLSMVSATALALTKKTRKRSRLQYLQGIGEASVQTQRSTLGDRLRISSIQDSGERVCEHVFRRRFGTSPRRMLGTIRF